MKPPSRTSLESNQGLIAARTLLRTSIDRVIDGARFRLDVVSGMDYQPLWVSRLRATRAKRACGSLSRLEQIARVVAEVHAATAVDIGANAGFFSLALADLGLNVAAVEPDPRFGRVITHLTRRAHVEGTVALLALTIDDETVELLPPVDAVLFLSVWHHIVMNAGLETATSILGKIWARSRKALFFETGQQEMGPDFHLPAMEPSPREWISSYLTETCREGQVEWLGSHQAFDPQLHPVMRELFVVRRTPTESTFDAMS